MSKRQCSICSSPHLAAIDDLLDGGATQKDSAAHFGVSKFALSRHVRHSNPTPVTPESADSLEARAALWRERADQLWHTATADADSRAMAQAVSAGLRSVELQARQKEREAEAAPDAEDDGKLSVEVLDKIVAWWDRVQAENDEKFTKLALEEAKRLRCPDLYQVFLKLWDSPALKERVLEFCRELFAEETSNESVSQQNDATQ